MSRVSDLYTFYADAERAAKNLSSTPSIVQSDPTNTKSYVRQVVDVVMSHEFSEWLCLHIKEVTDAWTKGENAPK